MPRPRKSTKSSTDLSSEGLPKQPKKQLSEAALALSPKNRLFIEHYVESGYKVKESWTKAGYKSTSNQPYRVLKLPEAKIYIRELTQPPVLNQDLRVDGTAVLQRLIDIAFSDIKHFFEIDANLKVVRMKCDLSDLPDHISAAIESIKVEEDTKTKNRTITVKMQDRMAALGKLARYFAVDMNPNELIAQVRALGYSVRDEFADDSGVENVVVEGEGDRLDEV